MCNYTYKCRVVKVLITLLFCLHTFLAKTQVVITFAGDRTSGYKDSVGINAEFSGPNGIAIDKAGNIFITDQNNNRIRKITPARVVTTIAGNGIAGFADGAGNNAEFNVPTRIAVDANDMLYVADEGNHRIRKITPAGVVSTLAGNGIAGYADGPGASAEFSYPTGVAVDTSGNVYVADQLNNLIRKVTRDGVVSTYAGNGGTGLVDGAALSAEFNHPIGTAVDSKGNVYVADWLHYAVRKITPAGIVSTLAGNGNQGYINGQGANAEFYSTIRVSVDTAGNVYVPDPGVNVLRKITPDGVVSTIAGSGAVGHYDTLALYATFSNPAGAAVDPDGNIFITEYNNNDVRELTSASSGPLPITLLNFSAQLKDKDALLNWQTASEQNTSYFNIQRSINGSYFSTISKVSAAGNSSIIKTYTYTDANCTALNTTALYYRLQEVDKDGKGTYSKIQILHVIKKIIITITPNPVQDIINITASADVKNAKISLIDISGKRYYTTVQNLFAGSQFQIPVSKLARGTYAVTIESDKVKEQVTIVKQ